jgi:hypothetical protein
MKTSYQNLNDAQIYEPGLISGPVQIWFSRNLCIPKFLMVGEMPTIEDMEHTHVLIGSIAETDKAEIFRMLQSPNWSPQGEADEMIFKMGTHISMSIHDIIVIGDEHWTVTRLGFELLNNPAGNEKAEISDPSHLMSQSENLIRDMLDAVSPQIIIEAMANVLQAEVNGRIDEDSDYISEISRIKNALYMMLAE